MPQEGEGGHPLDSQPSLSLAEMCTRKQLRNVLWASGGVAVFLRHFSRKENLELTNTHHGKPMEHQHLLRNHVSGLWDVTTSSFNILSEKAEPINMGMLGYSLLLGDDCQLYVISHKHLITQDCYQKKFLWL